VKETKQHPRDMRRNGKRWRLPKGAQTIARTFIQTSAHFFGNGAIGA
jgi:hypothetical protein